MDSILCRDAEKLWEDSEKIKEDLGKLEQDCSVWAREEEKSELIRLLKDLKELGIDVSIMTTDCVSAYQRNGSDSLRLIFRDLHQAFVYLDALFKDIKKTKSALEKTYIYPGLLDHLEINSERLTKTVEHIRKDIDG